MKNTLGLVGDGDDLDVIVNVEKTFDIKLTDSEGEQPRNVGQLYDLIERKYSSAEARACLSQAAFYRLRKALNSMGVSAEITPRTPVSILDGIKPRSIFLKWKALARNANLDLPALETSFGSRLPESTGIFVGVFIFALVATGLFYLMIWVHETTGVAIGWSMTGIMPAAVLAVICIGYLWIRVLGKIPQRICTIGDLARESAGQSFQKLIAEKNGSSPVDRWFALSAILRGVSGHRKSITRDTTFFTKDVASTG